MTKSGILFCFIFLISMGLLWSYPAKPAAAVHDDDTKQQPLLPKDNLPAELELESIPQGFENRPKVPKDNPLTEEKVQLGRRLFFDPILSEDKTVSCASCHQPDHGFASPDARAIGLGGRVGKRNAPSILNRAYGEIFLWDGGAKSLEDQVLTPISNPDELGGTVENVMAALKADESYVNDFTVAFAESETPPSVEYVTPTNLAHAIASFERTLLTGNSLVDRFRAADYGALSKSARQGMWIFESRGGCWKCHSGPNLTDEDFHNTGVGFGLADRDLGRTKITENTADRFKFKTPTLRGVQHTAPFMHDGSVKTLRDVVEFYNKGGAPDDPLLDEELKPLKLTEEEIVFLVDFLKALSN